MKCKRVATMLVSMGLLFAGSSAIACNGDKADKKADKAEVTATVTPVSANQKQSTAAPEKARRMTTAERIADRIRE